MIGIVIVAHGGLAREYLSAMEHVVGKKPGAIAIPIGPEDDVQAKQDEISQAVVDVDQGDGVIVVTDLVGSTPSNLAVCACTKANQRILYGVNMPMLIKLGQARNMTIDDAVSSALTSGRKYINSLQGFG